MELIRGLHNLRPRHHGCVATIGAFDGLHLGHREILARTLADGRVATVAVNDMLFHHPVRVGDVVSIFPTVEKLGRTSMTLAVEVRIFNAESGDERMVAECRIVFVAIDREGRPRPIRSAAT